MRVESAGFSVRGLCLRVLGSGFMVVGLGFRVWGLGISCGGTGCRVQEVGGLGVGLPLVLHRFVQHALRY